MTREDALVIQWRPPEVSSLIISKILSIPYESTYAIAIIKTKTYLCNTINNDGNMKKRRSK